MFERVEELTSRNDELKKMLVDMQELRSQFSGYSTSLREEILEDHEVARNFRGGLDTLIDNLGISPEAPLKHVEGHPGNIEAFRKTCELLQADISILYRSVPGNLNPAFQGTQRSWELLTEVLQSASGLSREHWAYRDKNLDSSGVDIALAELELEIQEANLLRDRLSTTFELDELPEAARLRSLQRTLNGAGLFGWIRKDVRAARRSLRDLSTTTSAKHKSLIELLPSLRKYRAMLDSMDEKYQSNPHLGSYYKGLNTPVRRLRELSKWYTMLEAKFGRGDHDRARIGNALRDLEQNSADILLSAVKSGLLERLNGALRELGVLKTALPRYFTEEAFNENIVSVELSKTGSDGSTNADERAPSGLLVTLLHELTTALGLVQPAVCDASQSLSQFRHLGVAWHTTLEDLQSWRASPVVQSTVPSLFDPPFTSLSAPVVADEDIKLAIALGQAALVSPALALAFQRPDPQVVVARLTAARGTLREACQSADVLYKEFIAHGEIDEACWVQRGGEALTSQIERNVQRLEHEPWLETWLSWQRVKNRNDAQCLSSLIDKLERKLISKSDVYDAIDVSVYDQLSRYLLEQEKEIGNIEGLHQNPLRKQFAELDKSIQSLQCKRVAYQCANHTPVPKGNSTGTVSTYTDMSLIQKEHSKKTRHIPIRQLLGRASGAINALKPCFMMSPMSVAQYLEAGKHEFDIIVMDEASQIRPEEALGAIGRAKQLVVVGDPKQLPPTSFFQKNSGESDDDEDVGVQQSESILDAVLPIFPKRRLRWHYRSRHQSLIQFSNKHFYDSNLVLFPSPHGDSEEYGLKFKRVANGVFDSSVNQEEAEEIAKFVAHQLLRRPGETVGVVAMNIKQSEAIDAALENLKMADPEVKDAVEKAENKNDEPLFIKNLERVQGDERDIIVISMTYGPNIVGGRTPQRFGPINSAIGWRRLNVLLTRSKKRMHVFSSMGSADVLDTDSMSRGKKALKGFLYYCEHGQVDTPKITGREPGSPFEVAVIRRLEDAGYDAVPQLGVAGFFLDIAVRDPNQPGRFLLAIECDGATYHSAKSARDRDRLRQEILENLGWQVHRIWSTDWFRNPDGQMAAVFKKLDQLGFRKAA